jgi:hypothetical protein
MAIKHRNTVKAARPFDQMGRFAQLGHFAIEWANDDDVAGKDVRAWIEGYEGSQWERADWGDEFIQWEPHAFPKDGQRRLKAWLSGIVKGPLTDARKRELEKETATIAGTFVIDWVDEVGGPVMSPRMVGSPLALAALGTMALASSELRDGFGQCEYCERFFLETGVRRGPRGRRFCPTRPCGVAARVRRFNEHRA